MERSRADSAAAGPRAPGTTAAAAQWNDWRWQMRSRVSTVEELGRYLRLSEAERAQIRVAGAQYRWSITPYYASLMDPDDPACPATAAAGAFG